MTTIDSLTELTATLETWNKIKGSAVDPVPHLKKIAELVEKETEAYFKRDPDPFDDRHPGRADPDCSLGHLLKAIFKNENFMDALTGPYISNSREENETHTVVCRLLLDCMPGLETSAVFQENEVLVSTLFQWAESASEPLRSYATGLLAGAMECSDVAGNFKDNNAVLVPIMLQRLKTLKNEMIEMGKNDVNHKATKIQENTARPFSIFALSKKDDSKKLDDQVQCAGISQTENDASHPKMHNINVDCSNSSWAEMEPYIIGSYQMFPLEVHMKQRLILQYLAPMGEYQEFLGHIFEHRAMDLIFQYIDLKKNKDVRLAFDALRYLASLLCHKKFVVDFLENNGIQRLLLVYRPSVAATGVSMCLYYLAYFEDAMERVCSSLPLCVLNDLVRYILWLLECSHESGRCHAIMSFSLAFQFRVILDLFDKENGLRRLYNVLSTQPVMNLEMDFESLLEDEVFTSRQAIRHTCVALKKYFEIHLIIKANSIRRSHARSEGFTPAADISQQKAFKYNADFLSECMDTMLEFTPVKTHWPPISTFEELGGIQLLLQLVAMAMDWSYYAGKTDTIHSALDVLAVCAVTPSVELKLCDSVSLPDNVSSPSVSILLGVADSEVSTDPEVQKAALGVIINCVCGPLYMLGGRFIGSSSKRRSSVRSGESVVSKMWQTFRANNGVMVLLKVLMTKTPITDADEIRALACRALLGLSRSETIRQILSKLPLFNKGQLQYLTREPILQDKRLEHVKFCKYGTELMEKVSGKKTDISEMSLESIRRSSVVAQTQITYNEKELLQIIHTHLLSNGLNESASALQREANLPRAITPPTVSQPEGVGLYHSPGVGTSATTLNCTSKLPRHTTTTSQPLASTSCINHVTEFSSSHDNRPSCSSPPPTGSLGPIKVNILSSKTPKTPGNVRTAASLKTPYKQLHTSESRPFTKNDNSGGSLEKIVKEYLRKQHALCKNPVTTVPSFSLFSPHQCPDPRLRNSAPCNITARWQRKMLYTPSGGYEGAKLDRKFIFTRFKSFQTYQDTEEDGCFSCCSFSQCEKYLMLGTYVGQLKLFNLNTQEEVQSYNCHDSPLTSLQQSRDTRLILTSSSSSWGSPMSSLWTMDSFFERRHSFSEDHHVEFSKQTQDQIIGTKDETARIYDVQTGNILMTLFDPEKTNNYVRNRATFNPTDDLVLNDGVLWDVRSCKAIHKFDKFNSYMSGLFHPQGLEIIINSEVWDIRTFHLLHTVPGLDQCQITFNYPGTIIYGAIHQFDDDDIGQEDRHKSVYGSTFRTFDATDYSHIATYDVKKEILDLNCDKNDRFLAVIENLKNQETFSEENLCRLYKVGMLRDQDEQGDDDDTEDDDREEEDPSEDDDDEEGDNNELSSASDEAEDNNEDDSEISFTGSASSEDRSEDMGSLGDQSDSGDDFDDDVLFELSNDYTGPLD